MTTALFSALYPAALPYFAAFLESLDAQSDGDFELWLSLDELAEAQIKNLLGERPANLLNVSGKSVATARDESLQIVCQNSDIVILVDSDDLLLPERVARAKLGLEHREVYGCALELMNAASQDLGLQFGPKSPPQNWRDFLANVNVFGLSNTAYRSETLSNCLGLAPDVQLVDWLLITRAIEQGASLTFDTDPQMRYRQYDSNTAKVTAPYTPEQVLRATNLVLEHYRHVLADTDDELYRTRQIEVERFFKAMQNSATCAKYTQALNTLKPVFYWWECVANGDLLEVWR